MKDPTVLIVWLFSWIAFAWMALRLFLRKYRRQKFNLGDYLTMGAMFCLIARLALIHVVLNWGTNNLTPAFRAHHHFTPGEIYRREIGSKLTLVNRVFYNSYIWLQKLVLLDFYRHLLHQLRWERVVMMIYLFVFAATYVCVQIITFTECDPFDHYWIIFPDPGTCTQAQVQLIVLGVLSILTDVMLIAMPIPVLVKLKRTFKQKIGLYILFSLGAFIVAVTLVRLPINHSHASAQVNRTTWASVELLSAALVAHAPALYGLRKRRPAESDSGGAGGYSSGNNRSGYGGGSGLHHGRNSRIQRQPSSVSSISKGREVSFELTSPTATYNHRNHFDPRPYGANNMAATGGSDSRLDDSSQKGILVISEIDARWEDEEKRSASD